MLSSLWLSRQDTYPSPGDVFELQTLDGVLSAVFVVRVEIFISPDGALLTYRLPTTLQLLEASCTGK